MKTHFYLIWNVNFRSRGKYVFLVIILFRLQVLALNWSIEQNSINMFSFNFIFKFICSRSQISLCSLPHHLPDGNNLCWCEWEREINVNYSLLRNLLIFIFSVNHSIVLTIYSARFVPSSLFSYFKSLFFSPLFLDFNAKIQRKYNQRQVLTLVWWDCIVHLWDSLHFVICFKMNSKVSCT